MEERIDWEFAKDSHRKKNIGHSAAKKVGKRRGCTLPSDYLTAAQKRKLNGEVVSVNMNAPIRWQEFKLLSKDIQERYINSLHDRFGVTRKDIAMMFHITQETFKRFVEIARLDIFAASRGNRLQDPDGWENFKKGLLTVQETEEDPLEELPPETAETFRKALEGAVEPEEKTGYIQVFDKFAVSFHGLENIDQMMTIIKNLPWNGQIRIKIEVETVGE